MKIKVTKKVLASGFGSLNVGSELEIDETDPRRKALGTHLLEIGAAVPLDAEKVDEGKSRSSSPQAKVSAPKTSKKRAKKSTSASRSTTPTD